MDRHKLLRGVNSGGATLPGETIEMSHSPANHDSNNEAQRDAQRGNRATARGKAEKTGASGHHTGGTIKKPANARGTAVHMERRAINANRSVAKGSQPQERYQVPLTANSSFTPTPSEDFCYWAVAL